MKNIALPADTPINSDFINYCITAFNGNFNRFKMLDKYFKNENDINDRIMADDSLPNNKLSHCFAKYISTLSTAYFMGNGVKYDADKAYLQEIETILEDNYFDTQNYEEAKEMSKKGISYELIYLNKDGQLRTKFLKADFVIPIFSSSIESFLSFVLRFYNINKINGVTEYYVDIYTKAEIITFKNVENSTWIEVPENRKLHLFDDVPIIIRRNNDEIKGDYEDVKTLIDAYDRAQSDTLNDLDYFTDAYLVLKGVEEIVEEDESTGTLAQRKTKCMKQRRTLSFPDGTGSAEFLVKEINDTATENFKNRVYKDIFFLSMVPNLTDENFSGNLTGVAQKYKLFGLEALTDEKEKYWKSAERKKLKLITKFINTLKSTNYDWRTIDISFDRSQIANLLEISEIMNNLRDLLSNETLVGMYPEVQNVSEELERIKKDKEQSENTALPDGIY